MITAGQSLARPWSAQTSSILRGLLPSKHSVCVTWIKTKPMTALNLCPPCSASRSCSSPLPASICVPCLETRFLVSKALACLCGRELWCGHTGSSSPLSIFSWSPPLLITHAIPQTLLMPASLCPCLSSGGASVRPSRSSPHAGRRPELFAPL